MGSINLVTVKKPQTPPAWSFLTMFRGFWALLNNLGYKNQEHQVLKRYRFNFEIGAFELYYPSFPQNEKSSVNITVFDD